MTCTKCKTGIPPKSQFCPGCGHQLSDLPHTTTPAVQTLWTGHPTVRSFEGTFFLAIVLLISGPILYGLSFIPPFSGWISEAQASANLAWSVLADILSLTEFFPEISLIAVIATVSFLLACVLFLKSWVRSRQIRYRLTPEYLIVMNGFLKRTQQQLLIKTIKDVKLEQSVLDRLVGVGTIAMTTSDPTFKELSIEGIPTPERVFDIFHRVWREDRLSQKP